MLLLSDGAVLLVAGTSVALGAMSFVLSPLLARRPAQLGVRDASGGAPAQPSRIRRDYVRALGALRDAEFDHAAGRLNDVDYASLRGDVLRGAVFSLRQGGGMAAASAAGITDADIEEAIRRADRERPTCRDCGVRPEPDAIYCSNCGRYLPAVCPACGTDVTMPASHFCANCGVQLAPTIPVG